VNSKEIKGKRKEERKEGEREGGRHGTGREKKGGRNYCK
jgi:hypothetical protein